MPYPAARPRIAHIGEYPPPPPLRIQTAVIL